MAHKIGEKWYGWIFFGAIILWGLVQYFLMQGLIILGVDSNYASGWATGIMVAVCVVWGTWIFAIKEDLEILNRIKRGLERSKLTKRSVDELDKDNKGLIEELKKIDKIGFLTSFFVGSVRKEINNQYLKNIDEIRSHKEDFAIVRAIESISLCIKYSFDSNYLCPSFHAKLNECLDGLKSRDSNETRLLLFNTVSMLDISKIRFTGGDSERIIDQYFVSPLIELLGSLINEKSVSSFSLLINTVSGLDREQVEVLTRKNIYNEIKKNYLQKSLNELLSMGQLASAEALISVFSNNNWRVEEDVRKMLSEYAQKAVEFLLPLKTTKSYEVVIAFCRGMLQSMDDEDVGRRVIIDTLSQSLKGLILIGSEDALVSALESTTLSMDLWYGWFDENETEECKKMDSLIWEILTSFSSDRNDEIRIKIVEALDVLISRYSREADHAMEKAGVSFSVNLDDTVDQINKLQRLSIDDSDEDLLEEVNQYAKRESDVCDNYLNKIEEYHLEGDRFYDAIKLKIAELHILMKSNSISSLIFSAKGFYGLLHEDSVRSDAIKGLLQSLRVLLSNGSEDAISAVLDILVWEEKASRDSNRKLRMGVEVDISLWVEEFEENEFYNLIFNSIKALSLLETDTALTLAGRSAVECSDFDYFRNKPEEYELNQIGKSMVGRLSAIGTKKAKEGVKSIFALLEDRKDMLNTIFSR